jgi:hypothetical protein
LKKGILRSSHAFTNKTNFISSLNSNKNSQDQSNKTFLILAYKWAR